MTVCKSFSRVPLKKGKSYKRAELVPNLYGPEKMAANYYDPPRNELYTFFDAESDHWINEYDPQTGVLRFRLKDGAPLGEDPPWERTKIRHVFLHEENHSAGDYTYLGSAIDLEYSPGAKLLRLQ